MSKSNNELVASYLSEAIEKLVSGEVSTDEVSRLVVDRVYGYDSKIPAKKRLGLVITTLHRLASFISVEAADRHMVETGDYRDLEDEFAQHTADAHDRLQDAMAKPPHLPIVITGPGGDFTKEMGGGDG